MPDHIHNGRNIELLIPASSLEVLKVAVMFGADAVYIGGEAFGLRAKAKNFSLEECDIYNMLCSISLILVKPDTMLMTKN